MSPAIPVGGEYESTGRLLPIAYSPGGGEGGVLRILRVGLAWVAGLLVVAVAGLAAFLVVAPPDLLRVATGYSAKIVCSNRFIAGRDAAQVMALDVQAPGHPLLKLVNVSVDETQRVVTARLLGLFATGMAVYRPGLGCASVPDGDIAAARQVALSDVPAPVAGSGIWPEGDSVEPATGPMLADILDNPALVGPQMRAVVVIKDGHLVAEAYGPGFAATTPQLGWSMAKTVNALLVGRLLQEGRIGLDEIGLFPGWAGDARKDISIRDLLGMESGLAFNEDYGDVSDVNRMLFLTPDMPGFVASLPAAAPPQTVFSYSSGTAVLLTRLWMDRLGDPQAALAYPRTALFEPLGMSSAIIEADARGTLVGSSYLYATPRDWARVGQFVLQDGIWNGERLVPEELMAMLRSSNGLPGWYSQGQTWLAGPHESEGEPMVGLPEDTLWFQGHDGQSMAVIPSRGLVVLRLGLTPWKLDYWPERLVQSIVEAMD